MKYPHIEHIEQKADKRKKAFYTQLKMLCSLYESTDTISSFRVKADLENCSKWLAFCFSVYYWITNSGILSTPFKQIVILAIACEISALSLANAIFDPHVYDFGTCLALFLISTVFAALLGGGIAFGIAAIIRKVKDILYDAKHYNWE